MALGVGFAAGVLGLEVTVGGIARGVARGAAAGGVGLEETVPAGRTVVRKPILSVVRGRVGEAADEREGPTRSCWPG